MKTTWELRKERNLSVPMKKDSAYQNIERVEKIFKPLFLSKNLEASLTFSSRQKVKKMSKREKLK